jgi:hypothetical protein
VAEFPSDSGLSREKRAGGVSERYPKNETVANSINTTILFSMARDAKGLKVALVVWVGDEPQLHSVMDF